MQGRYCLVGLQAASVKLQYDIIPTDEKCFVLTTMPVWLMHSAHVEISNNQGLIGRRKKTRDSGAS